MELSLVVLYWEKKKKEGKSSLLLVTLLCLDAKKKKKQIAINRMEEKSEISSRLKYSSLLSTIQYNIFIDCSDLFIVLYD